MFVLLVEYCQVLFTNNVQFIELLNAEAKSFIKTCGGYLLDNCRLGNLFNVKVTCFMRFTFPQQHMFCDELALFGVNIILKVEFIENTLAAADFENRSFALKNQMLI